MAVSIAVALIIILCAAPAVIILQLGVPLSVWQMNDEHNLAIFEAGIFLCLARMQKLLPLFSTKHWHPYKHWQCPR
jgi:hypothetical protein